MQNRQSSASAWALLVSDLEEILSMNGRRLHAGVT